MEGFRTGTYVLAFMIWKRPSVASMGSKYSWGQEGTHLDLRTSRARHGQVQVAGALSLQRLEVRD